MEDAGKEDEDGGRGREVWPWLACHASAPVRQCGWTRMGGGWAVDFPEVAFAGAASIQGVHSTHPRKDFAQSSIEATYR